MLAILAILLLATASQAFAMMGVRSVNKEQAKELGIEVRFQGNGPGEIWVELELKADAKIKDFDHVSLEIRDGNQFLFGFSALKEKKSSTGGLVFSFLVNRAFLDKVTLSVVSGPPGNFSGSELRLKDFFDATKP